MFKEIFQRTEMPMGTKFLHRNTHIGGKKGGSIDSDTSK